MNGRRSIGHCADLARIGEHCKAIALMFSRRGQTSRCKTPSKRAAPGHGQLQHADTLTVKLGSGGSGGSDLLFISLIFVFRDKINITSLPPLPPLLGIAAADMD
jgi:hypothetical protein